MAATKYTYSIASDFPVGGVNSTRLKAEIAASSIATGLDRIDTTGDVCDIWFDDALTTAEKTTLDGDASNPAGGLIAAHNSAATTKAFQFWEENTAETTTEETFQEKMARTAAALTEGIYRFSWSFEMKVTPSGALNSQGVGRFLVDGNVKSLVFHTLDNWVTYSGWDRYAAVAGETPELSLEIRRDPTLGGDDTIEIRKMKLGIEFMG